jgi:uncharacterized protein (UPF0335 family)
MTKLESERIDRVENHLKFIKSDVNDVLSALIGTDANGKKGLVPEVAIIQADIKLLKTEIELIKLENSKKDVVFEQLKYGFGVVFVGFVGIILKLLFG